MNLVSSRLPAQFSWRAALVLAGAAGAALLLAGCTTSPARSTAGAIPGDRIVLTEGQFEYVQVTGSNLPVVVPKNSVNRPVPQTASPVVSLSPEAFRRMQERALASSGR